MEMRFGLEGRSLYARRVEAILSCGGWCARCIGAGAMGVVIVRELFRDGWQRRAIAG